MYPFWPDIVQPALSLLAPRRILEIGSEAGKTTSLLLNYCEKHDAVLHAVDPAPLFDAEQHTQRYGDHFVFHRAKSLDVLATLEPIDAALIDGDHNWYTVYHELTQIAQTSAEHDVPLPLLFLHDVGWPYGRRDLYYDPDAIPAEARHPYARRGMKPGSSPLLATGGVNANLCNAEHEGGPRNGVFTAVEDFVGECDDKPIVAVVPAFHGLAIVLSPQLAEQRPHLAAFVNLWRVPSVQRMISRVESARIAANARNATRPSPVNPTAPQPPSGQ